MQTAAELRLAIHGLTTFANNDLRGLWRSVSTADQAKEALVNTLPDLAKTYRLASATVAADWYDELRDGAGITRRFSALVPDVTAVDAEPLAKWGVGPLYSSAPDWVSARSLIEGGLQRLIADAARDTVRESSIEDPEARGWQRETSGGCEFCELLAGRGVVYSEASADFASHNNCLCYAVPAFDGEPKPVQPYTPSLRESTPADRARVRDYIAAHRPVG